MSLSENKPKRLVDEYNLVKDARQGFKSWQDFESQCDELTNFDISNIPDSIIDFGSWLMGKIKTLREENEKLREDYNDMCNECKEEH